MARANAAYYATHDPFQDFTTAPEITQVFGELLGAWAAVTWDAMGRPSPVLLAECGPGRGTLMADALRAISQDRPRLPRRPQPAPRRNLPAPARRPSRALPRRHMARHRQTPCPQAR